MVAAEFILTGFAKLTDRAVVLDVFRSTGYPNWVMHVAGSFELFGAALLFVPRFAFVGAGLLTCVMAGTIVSHLAHGQPEKSGPALALLVLCIAIGTLRNWGRPLAQA